MRFMLLLVLALFVIAAMPFVAQQYLGQSQHAQAGPNDLEKPRCPPC